MPSVAADPSGAVTLIGDAVSVGRQLGELNGADIRQHMGQVLGMFRQRGLTDGRMIELSEPFRAFCRRFTAFWLDEAAACAEAAGVDADLFIAYQAGKYRALFLVEECTSFAAVGAATADGATLFHKTRDNAPRSQSIYRKQIIDSSRPASYYAIGDTSDTGHMMMANEHGLCGSADMGGLPGGRPKGRGVMNPYILRWAAERGECCEDALEIVQQAIRDGWYAGGEPISTHWLFADRHGKALRIAQNSDEEKHWFVEDDTLFLVRGETDGAKLATGRKGDITAADLNAAASHPSMCFPTSISALTVRVDPVNPARLSTMWVALPSWAPYVPLFSAADGVPTSLVAGAYFQAGHPQWPDGEEALPASYVRERDELQAKIGRRAASVDARVREAMAGGDAEAAAQLGAAGAREITNRAQAFLRETGAYVP